MLLVLWALPCSAWAGTVTPRVEYTGDGVGIDIVDFAAGPGEANQLDVDPGTSGLVLHDAVPITPQRAVHGGGRADGELPDQATR